MDASAVASEGPKFLGQLGEAPVSTGLMPGQEGLSEVGAISWDCVFNDSHSLLLQRVREPVGVVGMIDGIPEKMMA